MACAGAATLLNLWLLWPQWNTDTWAVLARDLPAGSAVTAGDLREVTGWAGTAPADVLDAAGAAAGPVLRVPMSAGQPVPRTAVIVDAVPEGRTRVAVAVGDDGVPDGCALAGATVIPWRAGKPITGPLPVTAVTREPGVVVLTVDMPSGETETFMAQAGSSPTSVSC